MERRSEAGRCGLFHWTHAVDQESLGDRLNDLLSSGWESGPFCPQDMSCALWLAVCLHVKRMCANNTPNDIRKGPMFIQQCIILATLCPPGWAVENDFGTLICHMYETENQREKCDLTSSF